MARQQVGAASGIMMSRQSSDHSMRTGILSAILAFLCWGLFPLYFHAIH